jgi:hypothetical protein
MAHTAILASWEAEIGRIEVGAQENNSQDSTSKITRAKWTGGVAQGVQRLLSKPKALSSNPVLPKKKTKRTHAPKAEFSFYTNAPSDC